MVDIADNRTGSKASAATLASAALFDPSDGEFLANPYPTYERLRAEDPVHRTPLGLWVLTRYDDRSEGDAAGARPRLAGPAAGMPRTPLGLHRARYGRVRLGPAPATAADARVHGETPATLAAWRKW
jgi:cytochrome P450